MRVDAGESERACRTAGVCLAIAIFACDPNKSMKGTCVSSKSHSPRSNVTTLVKKIKLEGVRSGSEDFESWGFAFATSPSFACSVK
mmetsp:Transcript_25338/g.44506  ORF Transcript_25338/g.44506 Transcript_25338/m.44506 type:complete len:86 (+) Transcript_25338:138-395(+)